MSSKLTINAGLRTEEEQVPIYGEVQASRPSRSSSRSARSWRRVLDSRTTSRVMAGRRSTDPGERLRHFKLEVPRGSSGGDKWTEYYYTLDTPDWTTVNTAAACPPACSGTLLRVTDFRLPTYSVNADDCASQGCTDPNLDPMKSRSSRPGSSASSARSGPARVRYVHKQIDKAIEDIGTITAEGNEAYVIGNPGFGPASIAHLDPTVEMPKAKRDYDGVEFAIEKRFANNWYLRTSYLLSRLDGD